MSCPDTITDPAAPVLLWREAGVARLRMNRPQALNAINREMAAAFLRACETIAADPAVRVVHISGAGRAFMAGGDLAELQADPQPVAADLIAGLHGGIRLLAQIDAPVVTQVQGAVMGGGLGATLACDLVVAAQGTRFGLAYPLIGASCDCSTSWALPRLVGLRKALELALLAEVIDADEALRLGLINRVVPAERIDAEVEALVQRLAQGPTRALGSIKRLMRASLETDLPTQLDAEARGFAACAVTADFREGVGAFLDKRPARFSGA